MVTARITRLAPSGHSIQVKRGTRRPAGASTEQDLGNNDQLILPSNQRQANLSFWDGNRAINGYHAVISTRSRGGIYRLPCRVSGGATLSWGQGNSSGCGSVLVRGLRSSSARAQGTTVVSAATNGAQMPNQHWATAYLQALVDRKILSGYPGGDLRPNQGVTREEFASMVSAANLYWQVPEIDQAANFKDVVTSRWSYQAIALAVRTRFLSGYPDQSFRPTQPIPIEQALVSLAHGLGLINDNIDLNFLSSLQDANAISDWARQGVAAAIQAGIVIDANATTLRPKSNATRAEIATLIYRALDRAAVTPPTPPINAYLMTFEQPPPDEETEAEDGAPEVIVSPLSQEPTLVQTDATETGVVITNLAASVRVDGYSLEDTSASTPTDSNRLDLGQRYTYRQSPTGDYQAYLSVISRQEREEIVQSEEIKSLLAADQWSPENPPNSQSIQAITRQLLKKSPVQSTVESVNGIRFQKTIIDLTDPDTLLTIGLGKGASYEAIYDKKNPVYGSESLSQLVNRYAGAAIVASGTFFNSSTAELYGNTVAAGQFLRYQSWEKRGTVLKIGEGNRPEMITLNQTDASYNPWDRTWFYLTAGPRLLKAGNIALDPGAEGFEAASLVNINQPDSRSAIAFPQDGHHLCLVTFLTPLSLQQSAQILQSMGYYEAMNLDGGASLGLAINGQVKVTPGRNLTHALVVYDASHLAPPDLLNQWNQFQSGNQLQVPDPNQPLPPPAMPTPGNYNSQIVQAMKDLGSFDSSSGPSGGVDACVWAVNQVLKQAGISPFNSNLVTDVEAELQAGRGIPINLNINELKPGDLVIAQKSVHMGIYLKANTVRSNSSSQKKFAWDSDLNFTIANRPGYAGSPSRAYRLIK